MSTQEKETSSSNSKDSKIDKSTKNLSNNNENDNPTIKIIPKNPNKSMSLLVSILIAIIVFLFGIIIDLILQNDNLVLFKSSKTTNNNIISNNQVENTLLITNNNDNNNSIINEEEQAKREVKDFLYSSLQAKFKEDFVIYPHQKVMLLHYDQKICPNHPRTLYFTNRFRKEYPSSLKYNPLAPSKMYIEHYTIKDPNYYILYMTNLNEDTGIFDTFKTADAHRTKEKFLANMLMLRRGRGGEPIFAQYMTKYQMWYFFPFGNYILLKESLYSHFVNLQNKFPSEFTYMPETFKFPSERNAFMDKYGKFNISSENMWLFKPSDSSRGAGIHLITDFTNFYKHGIVTRYINNPHLVRKRKYHLRVYALVHSFAPLKVYLYRGGVRRFTSEDYSNKVEDMTNKFIHITNNDINKKNPKYKTIEEYEKESGDVWSLNGLIKEFKNYNYDFKEIWEKIKDLFIKSFISVSDDITRDIENYFFKFNFLNYYKIYGADILIDDQFKPWLLEMNSFPDLYGNVESVKEVKTNLFTDVFNVLGMQPYHHFKPNITMDKQMSEEENMDSVIMESICEFTRPTGDLERIFPLKDNVKYYKKFFENPGLFNSMLWEKMNQFDI